MKVTKYFLKIIFGISYFFFIFYKDKSVSNWLWCRSSKKWKECVGICEGSVKGVKLYKLNTRNVRKTELQKIE